MHKLISDGPMNLSIVEYEDHLECSAEGNPTPIYRWTHVESNKSTDERILELNGIVTSDKDHTFICTASNILSAENTNITVKGWKSFNNSFSIKFLNFALQDHLFDC